MKTRRTSNIRLMAIAAVLLCAVGICAYAGNITVTNTNDSGAGSLRQAIVDANDGDTIDFAVTGIITLTSGELLVDKEVTISGPGTNELAVDGNAKNRVFHIDSGRTVTISGLTVMNGSAFGDFPDDDGGGIFNDHATLMLSNCVISENAAGDGGGGIFNYADTGSSSLQISNSVISGNSSSDGAGVYNRGVDQGAAALQISNSTLSDNFSDGGSGGAIANNGFGGKATVEAANSTLSGNIAGQGGAIHSIGDSGDATVVLTSCVISGNSTQTYGGGIVNNGEFGSATLTIRNCSVSSNTSGGADGGGIFNDGSEIGNATLTISDSTLNANSAFNGGAIANNGRDEGTGIVEISNSTLSANSAQVQGGGIYNDGGFSGNANVRVANSTLSGNSADSAGGAISNFVATVDISNNILNAGASAENIANDSGTVTSHGYNLSSDDGGGYLTGPGDQINTDPLLGALQDNGGPTFTHELLPGSPAIGAGDPKFTPPPLFDQRGPGFDRVVNGLLDIGSFEVQSGGPSPTPTPTVSPTPTSTPTVTPTPRVTPRPRPAPHPRPTPP